MSPKDSIGPCPACGYAKVLRSRRKGIKENILKFISAETRFYRCHQCGARFVMKQGERILRPA
jgi:DNA-directed RNA polymerase subunit RPC12/RpoP